MAESVFSSSKQFFGYLNLTSFSNSRLCFVPRNKFQIKACLLKDNRGYVFLALYPKMPGHMACLCASRWCSPDRNVSCTVS